jgi:hypothetical protein
VLTKNTLTSPNPTVTENLQGTSTVTGTIGVKSQRNFAISGYINTSHGKVQQQDFSSSQTIDFDVVNFTLLDQKTSVKNDLISSTSVSSNAGNMTTQGKWGFPITVDLYCRPTLNSALPWQPPRIIRPASLSCGRENG